MEELKIEFSEKNIPLCSLWNCKRSLLAEVGRFKERLRWKTVHFKNLNPKKNKKRTV